MLPRRILALEPLTTVNSFTNVLPTYSTLFLARFSPPKISVRQLSPSLDEFEYSAWQCPVVWRHGHAQVLNHGQTGSNPLPGQDRACETGFTETDPAKSLDDRLNIDESRIP